MAAKSKSVYSVETARRINAGIKLLKDEKAAFQGNDLRFWAKLFAKLTAKTTAPVTYDDALGLYHGFLTVDVDGIHKT